MIILSDSYFSGFIFVRQALEELLWQAGELLDRLDDLQEDVARADFADDVTGARRAIDAHADISKRLAKVPVDELEAQGHCYSFVLY